MQTLTLFCADTYLVLYGEVLESMEEEEQRGMDIVEAGCEGAALGLVTHIFLQGKLYAGLPTTTKDMVKNFKKKSQNRESYWFISLIILLELYYI